jgi:RNA polymerase sigma-70 factor (ECF subfamily)
METSASLLERLRSSPHDADWGQLVELYTPLIRVWVRRYSSSQQDADDVVQEVLSVVVRKLSAFERQRTGSFRNWLRSITVNCLRDSWRANRFRPSATGGSDFRQILDQMEDPQSQLSELWTQQHDQYVLRTLLDQVRPSLADETWQAFKRVSVDGESAADVAAALGMTVNSVYIAKSRVMSKIRELGAGLID